jgi:DNA polymerase elongation subunit (family B)
VKKPKILFYDIETSPNLGYTWGKYEQNVIAFQSESELISVSFKYQKTPAKTYSRRTLSEKSLLKIIAKEFLAADIVVAHNGDQFDRRVLHARLSANNLPPLPLTPSVDTKKVAKRYFRFNSNSLNDLAKFYKLGQKVNTGGFELWLECLAGNNDAWKRMEQYNKQDVVLLEKVYNKMFPWVQNHPNVAKILNPKAHSHDCPKCSSKNTIKKGVRAAGSIIKQQMVCKKCGGWFLVQRVS